MLTRRTTKIGMFGVIASLCLVVGILSVKAASEIVIAESSGQVEVKSPQVSSWKAVRIGTSLQLGDVVRTGPKSSAEIRFDSGIIRIYENTLLELPPQAGQLRVSDQTGQLKSVVLQKGRSWFQVFKNRLGGGFEVTSPSLIAGVKGTTFRVTEEENLKGVTVFEGVVRVSNRQNPLESVDVFADHYTILTEGHLTPAREIPAEKPSLENRGIIKKKMEDRRLETRLEERLTDLIEENRDLQTEAVSRSIRLEASSTTSTSALSDSLDNTLSSTSSTLTNTVGTGTGTVTGTVSGTEATLTDTVGTVTDLVGTSLIVLP